MMTRREFLALAGAATAASSLGAQAPGVRRGKKTEQAAPKAPLAPLAPFGKSIVAGAPTGTSVRLNVLIDEPMEARWRVGAGAWSDPAGLEPGKPQEIQLLGLLPGERNRWEIAGRRAGDSSPVWNPSGEVRTARAKGVPFRFAVHADPHNRDSGTSQVLHARALRRTVAGQPDFVIDLGDNFMTEKMAGSEADALQCVRDLRPLYGLLGGSIPLFLMNGNHEAELGWLRNGGLAIEANRLRRSHYPAPTHNGFYSGDTTEYPGIGRADVYSAWEWGDALFVLLDPFWYVERKPGRGGVRDGWGWTLGARQHEWLARTLASSNARAKFVFCHHLVGGGDACRGGVEFSHLYEWGGCDDDGRNRFAEMRPGWSKPVHDLMVEHRVTIFFHGHDHFYAKQERDGIVYQLVPQPSHENTRRHQAEEYGYREGVFIPNSGYLEVDVGTDEVEVRYIRFGPGDGGDAEVAHRYGLPLSG